MIVAWPTVYVTANLFGILMQPSLPGTPMYWVGKSVYVCVCVHCVNVCGLCNVVCVLSAHVCGRKVILITTNILAFHHPNYTVPL